MAKRNKEEIENLNKAVRKALGTAKSGKSFAQVRDALADDSVTDVQLRAALKSETVGAVCLGKTRKARYFAAATVEKYGEAALMGDGSPASESSAD